MILKNDGRTSPSFESPFCCWAVQSSCSLLDKAQQVVQVAAKGLIAAASVLYPALPPGLTFLPADADDKRVSISRRDLFFRHSQHTKALNCTGITHTPNTLLLLGQAGAGGVGEPQGCFHSSHRVDLWPAARIHPGDRVGSVGRGHQEGLVVSVALRDPIE